MPWEVRLKPMVHVVVGILQNNDKLLVAERPPGKPYSGYWEFPGGKVEQGETGQDALIRELREELGVEVVNAQPWLNHEHEYPDKTVYLELWLVTKFLGEPQSKENQTLRWATLAEIIELRLLEGNRRILDDIKTLFKTC